VIFQKIRYNLLHAKLAKKTPFFIIIWPCICHDQTMEKALIEKKRTEKQQFM